MADELTRPVVVLVGTLDTKGPEYGFVREQLKGNGCDVLLVDTGVLGEPSVPCDITSSAVAERSGSNLELLRERSDRAEAMEAMARGAARLAADLRAEGHLDAVLGLGGSNGAFVMSAVASALPFGVPKVLVSTMAASDTRPYVNGTDLTLIYPVVDISGLNRISRRVLANAAAACAGMAQSSVPGISGDKPLVAISMFGVTTPCCSAIRDRLEDSGAEVLTFHATGVGGQSMEGLIRSGLVRAVADITTTELADELVGGICSAGPSRLTAASQMGVPQVVSLGALDMVNFGPLETVPTRFASRLLYRHNPTITLMRTSPEECAELGSIVADKLNAATGPVVLLVPLRGMSQISAAGGPFYDPDADKALFSALSARLDSKVVVNEVDADVNDPRVAALASGIIEKWLAEEGSLLT